MGTRSLTRIIDTAFDGKEPIACIYRQMDGYPSGHGAELAKFLHGIKMVNGIGSADGVRIANGSGCLAAQLVAHLKAGPGSIYLYPPGAKDCGEEYIYTVFADHDSIKVEVKEGYHPKFKTIFNGDPAKFLAFCLNKAGA